MKSSNTEELVISALGITSAIGQGKSDFFQGLLKGENAFSVMQRPGRQRPDWRAEANFSSPFLGAEITDLILPNGISPGTIRTASLTALSALATVEEAWREANLAEVDSCRVGLVVGGSNLQQRELLQFQEKYKEKLDFLRPNYAFSYLDTDICGLCTEYFGIRGAALTVGGASASGQLAVLQAIEMVCSGQLDVCIAVGALMDLSYWECQSFRSAGAMGGNNLWEQPELAARPFDQSTDGFIYGESCAAVVIERESKLLSRKPQAKPYARILGSAMVMDAHRRPDPSFDGEVMVLQRVMSQSNLSPTEVDYVNPHGTGSSLGDQVELQALSHCQLNHAYINTTKSITGHGLTAAGAVELAAIVLQMKQGQLHPSRNLEQPISKDFNWVYNEPVEHQIESAINLSFGFGGVNTAICIQNYK